MRPHPLVLLLLAACPDAEAPAPVGAPTDVAGTDGAPVDTEALDTDPPGSDGRVVDTEPPSGDTEPGGTDPVDSDPPEAPVDSDPVETDPTAETHDTDDTDTGGPSVCLEPLDPPLMPATWDALIAVGETSCVRTSVCDPGGGRAVAFAWWPECEGSRVGFYGADRALFAEHELSDASTCALDLVDVWRGEVVDACSDDRAWDGMPSPGCARPDDLAWVPSAGCLLAGDPTVPRVGDVTAAGGVAAFAASTCVGLATCALGDRTLDLVYADDECGGALLDAWDRDTGALVASVGRTPLAAPCGLAPHWIGLDLSSCFPVAFTPSAACGVVPLPE